MDDHGMSRWLVTGASGQLGRSLCSAGREEGLEMIGLDHGSLDVTNRDAVLETVRREGPDLVVHTAAYTHVDRCEEDEDRARAVNADGTRNVAEAALSVSCPLLHVSTDYVFGGDTCRPISEEAHPDPRSAYGRTKEEGEAAVRNSGCEYLIVRSQWIFGHGHNFVRTIFESARKGNPLRVVDDQLGRPTSSRALARGILAAALAEARGALHLACEGVASWYDLAVATVEEAALRGWLEAVSIAPVSSAAFPRPAPRPPYSVLGLERSRSLGIRMPHWRDALRDYLDSEEWVNA